jgi:hypothetical protein
MYQLECFREKEGSLSTLEPVDTVKGDIEERPCWGCEGWDLGVSGYQRAYKYPSPFVPGLDNL